MEKDIYSLSYASLEKFIFVTFEGSTYQPDSESSEPDIENMQVIGTSFGYTRNEAYENLIKENDYLIDTSFDEIWCFRLADEGKYDCMFSLNLTRDKGISTRGANPKKTVNCVTPSSATFHIDASEISDIGVGDISEEDMQKILSYIENDEGIWEAIDVAKREAIASVLRK